MLGNRTSDAHEIENTPLHWYQTCSQAYLTLACRSCIHVHVFDLPLMEKKIQG